MTQQYTPVAWQDETTSQQGTLINAERLNQMQTAHHFADGFEEVDAVPTADPGVSYHKIVYCTADSTFYRWDGTEWIADIDDETKALLQQEIARATAAESQLNQRVDDEHDARLDAEAVINDRITDEATELAQRIATETSTRYTADTALGTRITNETSARETADTGLGNRITAEATARAEADTALGGRIDTEQARAEAAEQANAQAIANTYTKAEADTLLAGKADTSTVQTLDTRVGALETGLADTYNKSQTDTLLALKADQATTYTKTETDTLLAGYVTLGTAQTIPGVKTFSEDMTIQRAGGIWPSIYLGNGLGNVRLFFNSTNLCLGTTPASGADARAVATVGYIDSYAPMVRTTGNQPIAGEKVFTTARAINGMKEYQTTVTTLEKRAFIEINTNWRVHMLISSERTAAVSLVFVDIVNYQLTVSRTNLVGNTDSYPLKIYTDGTKYYLGMIQPYHQGISITILNYGDRYGQTSYSPLIDLDASTMEEVSSE